MADVIEQILAHLRAEDQAAMDAFIADGGDVHEIWEIEQRLGVGDASSWPSPAGTG